MSLQQRIREVLDGSGMTPAEFSRAAKVSQSAINQLTDGKTKSLKADTAAHIEVATGYKVTWLALGKGQKKTSQVATGAISKFPVNHSLESTVERLVEYLKCIPEHRRKAAAGILESLAIHPDDHRGCVNSLTALLPDDHLAETATGTDNAPI